METLQPGSSGTEAAEARGHLKEMPAWVLAEAPPPPAGGYAPTTEPSVTAAQ